MNVPGLLSQHRLIIFDRFYAVKLLSFTARDGPAVPSLSACAAVTWECRVNIDC